MERWRSNRRSLVLDTRGIGIGKLFCTGPSPPSVESSPWKLSDSFQGMCPSPGPSSPKPPRITPRRRARSSSSGARASQRPVSVNGPLLDESYAETKSFIQSRYHKEYPLHCEPANTMLHK